MRLLALLALACALSVGTARARVDIAVGVEDGTLYVDALVTGVFDEELDEALRSGLPARVGVEFVLWEDRTGLWDEEAARGSWQASVVFDVVGEVYTVFSPAGAVLLESPELSEVEEFVSAVELWPVCDLEDVDADRQHYLGVRFTVEPLSVEEVRDLERWLRGNVRDGDRLRNVPGQLVGVLRNRLGLGGRSERGRSADFVPAKLGPPR